MNIKSIDLPDSVEEIKSFAFRKAGLRSVKMPKALKAVEVWAFADCEMLSNVELNEGLERIDLSAFSDCCELKEVILPKTISKAIKHLYSSSPFGLG